MSIYPTPEILFNGTPADSGYYWISGFGAVHAPIVVYLDTSDQDAGGVRVQLPSGERVSDDHPGLKGVEWRGPLPYPDFTP